MCNELRTSKEHMRDFVLGKPIPKECGGKPLPRDRAACAKDPAGGPKEPLTNSNSSLNKKASFTRVFVNPYARKGPGLPISESEGKNEKSQRKQIIPNISSENGSISLETAVEASKTSICIRPAQQHFDIATRAVAVGSPATLQSIVPKAQHNPFTISEKKPPAKLVYSPGPVPFDAEAIKTWIYPIDDVYSKREYQFEIARSAILHNTLVSLPTGLGKTLIAAVVMYNFYRWFPTGKVIFMAPTLPLVNQQVKACYDIMGIPAGDTAVLTGKTQADRRNGVWNEKRVFFCTPQTVERDLEAQRCPASRVVCIVFDEAHKATGDYSYVKVQKIIRESGAQFRILGLSATPGTNIKAIQQVIDALNISRIEVRSDDDDTVKPYVHGREFELVVVPQAPACGSILARINDILIPLFDKSRNAAPKLLGDSPPTNPYQVLKAQQQCKANPEKRRFIPHLIALYYFVSLKSDLQKQGVNVTGSRLRKLDNERPKGVLASIVKSSEFRALRHEVDEAMKTDEGSESNLENNPKLQKLEELLLEHFQREKASGTSSRVIVFSQFRDSVSEIVRVLSKNHPIVRARHFIGQGNSSKSNGDTNIDHLKGMKQQEQFQVIREFRDDVYNVLVCTCIGEEGLDIGEVDLIVNYDTLRSPIRMIQRTGRTGRKRSGRVVCLVAEGPEQNTYSASKQSEKTLIRALKNPRSFSTHPVAPMFPYAPALCEVNMQISQTFHMSQVEGHQGQGHGKIPSMISSRNRWRLNSVEKEICTKILGQWWKTDPEVRPSASDLRAYFLASMASSRSRKRLHNSPGYMIASSSSIFWHLSQSNGGQSIESVPLNSRALLRKPGMSAIGSVFPTAPVDDYIKYRQRNSNKSNISKATEISPKTQYSTQDKGVQQLRQNDVELRTAHPKVRNEGSSNLLERQEVNYPQKSKQTPTTRNNDPSAIDETNTSNLPGNRSEALAASKTRSTGSSFEIFALPPVCEVDDDSSASSSSQGTMDFSNIPFRSADQRDSVNQDQACATVVERFKLPSQDDSSSEDESIISKLERSDIVQPLGACGEAKVDLLTRSISNFAQEQSQLFKTRDSPCINIGQTHKKRPRRRKRAILDSQEDDAEIAGSENRVSSKENLSVDPLDDTPKRRRFFDNHESLIDTPKEKAIDDIKCRVCDSGESPDEDPIVLCDGESCNLAFHVSCYSIPYKSLFSDAEWRCDPCDYRHKGGTQQVRCSECEPEKACSLPLKRFGGIWIHAKQHHNGKSNQRTRRKNGNRANLQKRFYEGNFFDEEASIDSDDDIEGDAEDHDLIREIEKEEEEMHGSFINDSSQLSGDGDTNQGRFEREKESMNQFSTPWLNQRNKRQKLGIYSGTPSEAPDSEKGLGNMNFIRSVIEHHRNGGTADEIENIYLQLEEAEDTDGESLIPEHRPPERRIVQYFSSDSED